MEFDINKYARDFNEVFFEVDGVEYSIIPLTLEEESKLSFLYKDEDKKVMQDLSKLVILTKLNKVPFTKEHINSYIKVDKDWSELSYQERFDFLKCMQSFYLIKLINAYVSSSGEEKEDEELKK